MEKWLKVSRDFNAIVRDETARKGSAEVASGSPDRSMYNRLQQGGIRDAIRARSPELADLNRQVSQAITFKRGLEELAKQDPSRLSRIVPLVGGGVVAGVMHSLGIGSGHLGAEAMIPVAGAGIAGYIIRESLKDPAVLMRVGIGLKRMGEGPLATALFEAVGQTPKLSYTGQNQLHLIPQTPQQ